MIMIVDCSCFRWMSMYVKFVQKEIQKVPCCYVMVVMIVIIHTVLSHHYLLYLEETGDVLDVWQRYAIYS